MDLFVIGFGVFAIFLAFKTIKIVPQQNAWVVERLGKFHAALEPGLWQHHGVTGHHGV